MLFSGGACSRRVSLSLKPFSFPRRNTKLKRERERVGSWERAGEFCLRRCVLFCVECRGREERGKKDSSFGNEEKERILRIFFIFSFFFRQNAQTYTHTQALKGERTEYWVLRNRSIDQR